jgi:hypothetical protein
MCTIGGIGGPWKMRTIITALATTLMFFSGTLCDGLAFDLDTEALALTSEESESDSHTEYPSSKRDGLKADGKQIVQRIGNKTFEEMRTKRKLAAEKQREMDCCTAERRRIPDKKEAASENLGKKAIDGSRKPTDKDDVIIDEDLSVSNINAVQVGRAPDSVNNRSVYEITVDVDNKGDRGKVIILLTGKGRDGREIGSVMLKDVLDGKESKTLTATASLTSIKSREICSWEVFRAYKFVGSLTG